MYITTECFFTFLLFDQCSVSCPGVVHFDLVFRFLAYGIME